MLASLGLAEIFALTCLGVLLDVALGEPSRWHPLACFARIAGAIEARFNSRAGHGTATLGALATAALVGLPALVLVGALARLPTWGALALHGFALYFALGARSLHEHLRPVARAIDAGDLPQARGLAARVVSRDLEDASEGEVARAAVESALENGNDAVFGALAWFAIAGAPGVVAYRLANTLDAMWGYRTSRFARFGWAAARLDDLMNLLPARLTALSYAALGNTRGALGCWRRQARKWSSPNAGPVMAAGAGALGLALGGPARYHGLLEPRPALGEGDHPSARDIERALGLVRRAMALWLGVLGACALAAMGAAHA